MKTSELTGAALDWAVADAIGEYKPVAVPRYSTDWSQGGPIIERMKLNRLTTNMIGGYTASVKVKLINIEGDEYIKWAHGSGPTPLIAAMRCYVASRMGDEVDVPKELT